MKTIGFLALAATLGMSSLAHAQTTGQKLEDAALVGGAVGSPISTLVFTAVDVGAAATNHDLGTIYGGVELGVNTVLAVDMTYWAVKLDVARDNNHTFNMIAAGMAACNLALAIHGGYLLATQEHAAPMLSVSMGHVRGVVAPSVVSDGLSIAPGAMLGGSF